MIAYAIHIIYPPLLIVRLYEYCTLSPEFTLIAANCFLSHKIGRKVYVSVAPGVDPAVPSASLYQATNVSTEVVFEVMKPHTVVVPASTMCCCWPCTVDELAVKGVA